jgi:hypothetical protein
MWYWGMSACAFVEGECLDYCGVITIESGVGKDRERPLSLVRSFILEIRIKTKKAHRKINTNI